VSIRELHVLGTSSQTPTRERNHNGYLLRWDQHGILFDPGEGTQRQFSFAGLSPSVITQICLTHFHGDHCLGLPGVLMRLSADQVSHVVDLHYPASGEMYLQRLRHSSIGHDNLALSLHPIDTPELHLIHTGNDIQIRAARLNHRVEAFGYRVEAPAGVTMIPELLESYGVHGPVIGELRAHGEVVVNGRTVTLDQVSQPRPGQVFALIMDTAWCDAAVDLARDADLVVCESTFTDAEVDLAAATGHLTARQAGLIAAEAGARHLVLSHFSQRYPDTEVFRAEAAEVFPEVTAAKDFDRIKIPRR
jgi:ribonuclease Z